MSTQYLLGAIALAVLGAGWLFLKIMDRVDHAKQLRISAAWRAANPPDPPLSPEQRAAFAAWVEADTLPAIILTPGDAPVEPGGTRIGGPAWLAEGEDWPCDREGRAMEFVAQVDFGALPAIPDFPEAGLLQFFISMGSLYGMDLKQPDQCDTHVIWRPDPVPGRLVAPPPLDPETGMTPLAPAARDTGVSLTGKTGAMPPTLLDWHVDELLGNSIDADATCEALEERGAAFGMVHQVGGHPVYTQWDYRTPERFGDYNRTLLRLTSDNAVQWGDMGEAAFTIRREDLLVRCFDRVIFWWDCT